jgi:nitrogen fixation protein NifU and related proteins
VSAVQYSDVIRQRFRNPRFRGRLATANAAFEDVNPLCGDRIAIECRMEAGRLTEARHHGDCCAICGASADLLIEMGLGRTAEELARLGAGDILERLEADIRPTRLKCVTLPLIVLHGALAGKQVAR